MTTPTWARSPATPPGSAGTGCWSARTPPTRAKGFYWAGLASTRAGDRKGAERYFEMAAAYPDARPVEGAREEAGKGVAATLDGAELKLGSAALCGVGDKQRDAAQKAAGFASLIWFAREGADAVPIRIGQALRHDAAETVHALQAKGYAIEILSGDRQDIVDGVAADLGIASARGGLSPADKIARIEALKEEGHRVLMLGDGLNDAPALAAADVSMSPVTAVHLSQAAADAVFLGERLAPVVTALTVSKRARAIMGQNLWLAVIYNMVAVPVAIAGLVTPLIAALAMSGSSILVTTNALRARFAGGKA